jgi:transposase
MLGPAKQVAPKLFYQLSLEALVPADHLLRRVAAAVDLGFVRRLTARCYSHTGQPGVDPAVLFKMALVGWLYGIASERRLADECRLHLAYRWFLGYDLDETPPDHSVLTKARARFGVTIYQAFFAEVVRQCERAGLVRGNQLYVDSTLVEADAGAGSVGARALVAQLAGIEEYVAALWAENPPPAAPAEPAGAGDATAAPPVAARLHPVGPDDPPSGARPPLNVMQASRTDPDAGLVRRPGLRLDLYHKVHVGVDGGAARIITAIEVTPGEVTDEAVLDRLLKEHAGATGRAVAEVVADARYGTLPVYRALDAAGIRASIPPIPPRDRARAVPREAFTYDAAADQYVCPEGQVLRRHAHTASAAAGGGTIYWGDPTACGACPRRATCCPRAAARSLVRPDDPGWRERARAHLATPAGGRSLRRRKCWVEPAIAELKERHGLARAHLRGRTKLRMAAYGAAIAYNLKKLARHLERAPAAPARAVRLVPSGHPIASPHRPARRRRLAHRRPTPLRGCPGQPTSRLPHRPNPSSATGSS